MDNTAIIVQVLAHTGFALFVITLTWSIVRGRLPRDPSERKERHD